MALIAELLISIQNSIILILRPHGIMTGYTCHHPAGSWIRYFRTDRMGKPTLVFMTDGADLQTVAFQKRHVIAAVGVVTICTVIDAVVAILAVLILFY